VIPTAVAVDDLLTFLGLPSDGIRTDELTAYAVAATESLAPSSRENSLPASP